MRMLDLRLSPGRRELRQFGVVALAVLGVLGAIAFVRGSLLGFDLDGASSTVALVLLVLGAFSGLAAYVAPQFNRPLYVLLTLLTYPIGLVVSFVIMGVLFFGVITPLSLALRVFRGDALARRFDRRLPVVDFCTLCG